MKVAELVTDTPTRLALEAKARRDAENGVYEEPACNAAGSYQQQLFQGAAAHVYALAHGKRAARLVRMKGTV